jgi:chitin disaccharide deacetylase
MQPNPVLRKLGLRDDDRVAIIHADDIGMCHASVRAYADLVTTPLPNPR